MEANPPPDVDYNTKKPDSSFNPQYPYNHATISRSGHEFHVDDTPGNERLKYYHTAGTGFEIGTGGIYTFVANNTGYSYYKSGYALTVDANYDIKVGHNFNLQVDSDIYQSAQGSQTITALDEITIGSGSVVHIHTNTDLEMNAVGSMHLGIDENIYQRVGKDFKTTVAGDSTELITGSKTISASDISILAGAIGSVGISALTIGLSSGTTISINATGKLTVSSPLLVEIKSGVAVNVIAGGAVSVTAGGAVSVAAPAGPISMLASGPISMTSGSLISMTAPLIKLN